MELKSFEETSLISLLNKELNILVGRAGSGKSLLLENFKEEVENDKSLNIISYLGRNFIEMEKALAIDSFADCNKKFDGLMESSSFSGENLIIECDDFLQVASVSRIDPEAYNKFIKLLSTAIEKGAKIIITIQSLHVFPSVDSFLKEIGVELDNLNHQILYLSLSDFSPVNSRVVGIWKVNLKNPFQIYPEANIERTPLDYCLTMTGELYKVNSSVEKSEFIRGAQEARKEKKNSFLSIMKNFILNSDNSYKLSIVTNKGEFIEDIHDLEVESVENALLRHSSETLFYFDILNKKGEGIDWDKSQLSDFFEDVLVKIITDKTTITTNIKGYARKETLNVLKGSIGSKRSVVISGRPEIIINPEFIVSIEVYPTKIKGF